MSVARMQLTARVGVPAPTDRSRWARGHVSDWMSGARRTNHFRCPRVGDGVEIERKLESAKAAFDTDDTHTHSLTPTPTPTVVIRRT